MVTVPEAIEVFDHELESAPHEIADAWRIVRGHVRRRQRPPSQTGIPAVEEPTTAKQHFIAATEELKKGSEPPR